MWLLPVFSGFGRIAMHTYFQLHVDGYGVPREGPVLLVANHPNSLLDPALVSAAARRPVRFLAKATLFDEPGIGLLVRWVGSIPVHRRQDDPSLMARNVGAFDAAYDALAGGSAIGIFPEGVSHDEPSMAPLRTGAARIALGAAERTSGPFPIVPVGLVFREKERFRSEAIVIVGEPVEWADLAVQGISAEGVRDLTARIEHALRRVTLNLESWEDVPLVEGAYEIFAAEFRIRDTAARQVERLREGTHRLAELRRSGDDRWRLIARDVIRHQKMLRRLGLSANDLHATASLGSAAWRAGRVLPYLAALAMFGGAIGTFVFWPPYLLVSLTDRVLKPQPYVRATTKVLSGIVLFGLYIALISLILAWRVGVRWGIVAAIGLPLAALVTVAFHERWREGLQEVRRFVLRRRRAERLGELRARQRRIAEQIAELVDAPVEVAP